MGTVEVDLVNALKALDFKANEAKKLAASAISKLGVQAPLTSLVKEALQQKMHPGKVVAPVEVHDTQPEAAPAEPQLPVVDNVLDVDPHTSTRSSNHRRHNAETELRPPPKPRGVKFHWVYFCFVGWWLGAIVLTLRLVLFGLETMFEDETEKKPSAKALFGWW